jgi:sugar lactone lactonase YvrE
MIQTLFWVDIEEKRIHTYHPKSNRHFHYSLHQKVGCIVPTHSPDKVLAALEDCYGIFDLTSSRFEILAKLEADLPLNRFNDGVCDPRGRFIFGSMCPGSALSPEAAVYQFSGNTCKKLLAGFYTVNGLAFSPDGSIFYLSDSHPQVQTVWAFDYDLETGSVSHQRIFFQTFDLPGRPDGAAVDAEGGYWSACIGGSQIVRVLPCGTIDQTICLPFDSPTKIAFGDEDLQTLYITSKASASQGAAKLCSLKLRFKGLEVNRFRSSKA